MQPGQDVYRLVISVMSDFDGVIIEQPGSDVNTVLEQTERRTQGVPSNLLEEEVHKEFSFLLCPECKQKYCANPLNLPLRGIIVPETIPDPGDE